VRLIVCGGRNYANTSRVYRYLDGLIERYRIEMVAQGGAPGADTIARDWCEDRQVDYATYLARWDADGRSAGPRRNQRMFDNFKPDLVVAFPGGRGTGSMVIIARTGGCKVLEVLG
jgi:hypothetical protein